MGLFLPHERGAPFSRLGCPFSVRLQAIFQASSTNTTEVNHCTIFELIIIVDTSQHSWIQRSYIYVHMASSFVFPIPNISRYLKTHNNFKTTIFGHGTSKKHCFSKGGADPTSLRPRPDLVERASTRKICRGWRCWRPGWGLGVGVLGGWWVGYKRRPPGIHEPLVLKYEQPSKKGDVSQNKWLFTGCPGCCIFSFRFLFVFAFLLRLFLRQQY